MIFKDANCGFYSFHRDGLYASAFDEVRQVCDKFGITVCAWYNKDRAGVSVREANEQTLIRCTEDGSVPVIRLLPPAFPLECYNEEELGRLAFNERAAFRIHPQEDAAPIRDWVFGWMLPVIAESKAPLLVSMQEADMQDLAALKRTYPELRLILTDTTQWMNRQYVRFVTEFPETYLEISNTIEYYGLESLCGILGAEKLLFGTGMPEKEPYDKIYQMIYSDLSDEQLALIAHGNFERLFERGDV